MLPARSARLCNGNDGDGGGKDDGRDFHLDYLSCLMIKII